MADEESQRENKIMAGAAIGLAARRGIFGGRRGGSAGAGAGAGSDEGRPVSGGSAILTAAIVIVVLFGMLAAMFYANG